MKYWKALLSSLTKRAISIFYLLRCHYDFTKDVRVINRSVVGLCTFTGNSNLEIEECRILIM